MVKPNQSASQKFAKKNEKKEKKSKTPSLFKLIKSEFAIVIDNQEKTGWDFGNIPADASQGAKNGEPVVTMIDRSRHLDFGDYAVAGMEQLFRIERKSKEDLYGTIAGVVKHWSEHDKKVRARKNLIKLNPNDDIPEIEYEPHWFERQLEGLESLNGFGHLIVEATFGIVVSKAPPNTAMHPRSISRTILKWMQKYPSIHFHFMDNKRLAELFAYRLMESFHKNQLRKEEKAKC